MPFHAEVLELAPDVREAMRGRSWHDDPACMPFDALRLVRLTHAHPDGDERTGALVVAASIVDDVVAIFGELHAIGFPIERMEPIDAFDGDDDASMEANNSSAFNHRVIAGGHVLSHHAYGVAIDVNPRWNPMILDGVVHPPSGVPFADRTRVVPGSIHRGGKVVAAFEARGFEWGGDWPDLRDYHHFSKRRRGR